MHEPSLIPGPGAGASAQNMPIRAMCETIVVAPAGITRNFAGDKVATTTTNKAIPENHALCVCSISPLVLTLQSPGDPDIVLPIPAGFRRIVVIRPVSQVLAKSDDQYSLWIEDLRAMEPWICDAKYRTY